MNRRLSDKKINVDRYFNIVVPNENNEDIVIDVIETRFVYKKTLYSGITGSEIEIYTLILKDGFLSNFCNKYQLKKKYLGFIPIDRINVDVSEDDTVLLETYKIRISDRDWYKRWNREQKLKMILCEQVNTKN